MILPLIVLKIIEHFIAQVILLKYNNFYNLYSHNNINYIACDYAVLTVYFSNNLREIIIEFADEI